MLLQFIKNSGHIVVPSRHLDVCSDPDNDTFWNVPDKAGADHLITGNSRHFPKFWKETKIITSREFVGIAAPHQIS